MRKYLGVRSPFTGPNVWIVEDDIAVPLDMYLDVWAHSPDGFEWGYSGSGPAQLALAILCDAFDSVELAVLWYQDFKREVIASLPHDDWELEEGDILDWLIRKLIRELYAHGTIALDLGMEDAP